MSASDQNPPPPVYRIPSNYDHEHVCALFLGPKAENNTLLNKCFNIVVQQQTAARQAYFPTDPEFIPPEIQAQDAYLKKADELQRKLDRLLRDLGQCSIPFYSPRYSAHMSSDQSLPAILGYLATMFYNPNNVAFEASPYTSQIEYLVGKQMCEMMGYNGDRAWGHITCDGTVANLESIWVYRNLKFYPLSLRSAMGPGEDLEFIADTFEVELCNGTKKLLRQCSPWEMLNLPVAVILDIPDRLYAEYSITSAYLDTALTKYLVQYVGKDVLMKKWGIEYQPTVVVPSTKHYSWPKSGALAGVGFENVVDIGVDVDARMDISKLRTYLKKCASQGKAVYEVVAVIGTTEEGAVDRLVDIVKLRDELKRDGLSFAIHADAAWGGYFATMLPAEKEGIPTPTMPYVPHVGLRCDTEGQLFALRLADSITVDPHKAGYIPYPAGGLCYKDGRLRYLVTWTAPYIDQGDLGESIGTYGVEGSKPGAAATSVYLAHQVIGLNPEGYGVLLGEASFTCRRFASHWATMSDDSTSFIVVPLNRLPAEAKDPSDTKGINREKRIIRERIIGVSNEVLVNDLEAMNLLNKLGSDLNINAFACNFRRRDGSINKDIEEANALNRRIFQRLSVKPPGQEHLPIPFYVTSTTFKTDEYGECAKLFKQRLGLEGPQDLFVLRNVVMCPFSTSYGFLRQLTDSFQKLLEEEVEIARARAEEKPEIHTFVVQGMDKFNLVLTPSFQRASGRRQIILSAELDLSAEDRQKYAEIKLPISIPVMRLRNASPMYLDEFADGKNFEATLLIGKDWEKKVTVKNVQIVKKRSLDSEDFDSSYPTLMPFYLYGSLTQPHIDHMLLLAPNIQLSAGSIELKLNSGSSVTDADLAKGVIAVAQDVRERAMQPFSIIDPQEVPEAFFFKAGTQMVVKIYRDPFPASTTGRISMDDVTELLGEGSIRLRGDVYVDSALINGEVARSYRRAYRSARQELSHMMDDATKEKWIEAVNTMHKEMSA